MFQSDNASTHPRPLLAFDKHAHDSPYPVIYRINDRTVGKLQV